MSTRWNYQVVEFKLKTFGGLDPKALQEELNRQGSLGWELVNTVVPAAYYGLTLIFKREA